MLPRATSLTPQELNRAIVRSPLVVSPQTKVMTAILQMSVLHTLCNTTVNPDSQIEALHQEARSSCVIVVAQGQVVGILTERDVVRLLTQQQPLDSLEIGQVMAAPVVTLRESALTDVFFVLQLLNHYQIRHLPLVDSHGHPVGLVTDETLWQISRSIDIWRWRLVAEVMTREVICAAPESSILEIAQLIAAHQVGYVVILQSGGSKTAAERIPLGIIDERDLVQLQALGWSYATCLAEAVMSRPIFTVKPEESLDTVHQLMEQRLTRHLAVMGNQGELLGIVSQSSWLPAFNPREIYKLAQVLQQKVVSLEAEKQALLSPRHRELEQQAAARTADLQTKAERQKLVAQIANSIRTSLNLQEVLDIGVAEVRGFLQCDRVLVYQLQPDGSGMMIAESVAGGWLQALGEQIKDACFGELLTRLYDCEHPIAVNNIYTRGYSDCHLRLLEQYQVKALLVMPIRVREQLWGLLLGHQCTATREWQTEDLNLLQEISVQLAIAIQQATTHQQLQQELIARQLTETRLRESEQRYVTLAATVAVGIFRTDRAGNCIYINQRGCEILGLTADTTSGYRWQQRLHPEDRQRVMLEIKRSQEENLPFELEYRLQFPDGTVKWLYGQAVGERDGDGQVIGYIGTITDMTERKQAEQQLEAQNTLLAKIAKDEPLSEVLNQLIDSLEQNLNRACCSVLLLDQDNRLRHGAAPKLPPDYNQAVDGLKIGEGVGSCGTAAFRQETVIVANIAIDPLWQDLKELALHHRLQACWSIPIMASNGRVLGTVAVYYSEVRSPQPQELEIITRMANIGGIALERQQAEEALQKSEVRWQFALEGAGDGVWDWNIETNRVFFSQQWKTMLGYTQDEVGNTPEEWDSYIHPDDIAQYYSALHRYFSGETPTYQNEHRVRCKDGSYKWILDRGKVMESQAGGKPLKMIGTYTDISDRKKYEQQLQQLNQKLEAKVKKSTSQLWQVNSLQRAILDSANYSIISTDSTGIIHTFNAAAERMLGYSAAEMVGKLVLEIIHDRQEVINRAASLSVELGKEVSPGFEVLVGRSSQGIVTEQEWIYVRKDGSRFPVLLSVTALYDKYKKIIGFLAIAQDITQRKQAAAQLQEQEEFLRSIYNGVDYPIFVIDVLDRHEFVCVDWNAAAEKASGISSSEIVGKSPEALFGIRAGGINGKRLQLCLTTGTSISYEELLDFPGKRARWWLTTLNPLKDSGGNIYRIVGTMFDISDRKQAEQIICQQAEEEKLLREITQRIRQSLDIQTIFDTACQEIRSVLQADRVGIFKFYPDSGYDVGEFVAESVVKGFRSLVSMRVHDHCFGENYSSLYAKGRFYAIDDIYHGGLRTCHSDILSKCEVRANMVMPLLCGDRLWGLLCVHQCATTRHWQEFEIDFTQQIANQLAIAIQQASLYDQIQSELLVRQQAEAKIALQLRRQQALGAIAQQIKESLDIKDILTTVTQQVKDVLQCDRVIAFQLFPSGRSQIVEEAVASELLRLKDLYWENETWSEEILQNYWQGKPRIVPDVMNDIWTDCLIKYSIAAQIKSKIVAPILQQVGSIENHRWVAPGESKRLWGILVVHACREKRVWQESEAQLLQQIANQLAIAIQQASLFEQLQQELSERQIAQQLLSQRNQQLAISNQELARATRLKDEFLANMSHELRTPLNAILGMTEGLQEEVFGNVNSRQIKALETIERSGQHLLELINDILDVAKIESGQIDLDCQPTDVAQLCQSSLAFIKQLALKKHITLEIKLPLNLPDLLIDERRIRQVLINLLNNAVKFTPAGGLITLEVSLKKQTKAIEPPPLEGITRVRVYRTPLEQQLGLSPQTPPISAEEALAVTTYLQISVRDTGIGIAQEHIDRLFQPFVQIDSALNRQYSGTGLGLSLVKRIVEVHGGQVGVTSREGIGSCFTINLPCAALSPSASQLQTQPKATSAPSSSSNSLPAAEASPLILLAEDNEANISTISSYLRAKGYRLRLATNGLEAIAMAQSQPPDLIVMDIQMPQMDGLEAIQQIRRHPNLVKVPIVALTALAMPGDRERCLDAGATDYLTKPVKLKQLASMIQQLLSPSHWQTECS